MNLSEALAARVEQARQLTLKTIGEFSDDQMMYQPQEGLNHPMWILGHIVTSQDGLLRAACFGKERKRPDWMGLFGMKTKPSPDRSIYPSREEILDAGAAIHREAAELVRGMSDEELFSALPKEAPLAGMAKTKAGLVMMEFWHEGLHQGQLLYLRRMLGKPPLM